MKHTCIYKKYTCIDQKVGYWVSGRNTVCKFLTILTSILYFIYLFILDTVCCMVLHFFHRVDTAIRNIVVDFPLFCMQWMVLS